MKGSMEFSGVDGLRAIPAFILFFLMNSSAFKGLFASTWTEIISAPASLKSSMKSIGSVTIK